MYDCDPGGLLVVLVILHCVHATGAVIKIACSVEEDECEVNASLGCKAEGKSTAPLDCSLVPRPIRHFISGKAERVLLYSVCTEEGGCHRNRQCFRRR